jgi:type IV pilus assembly protein PilC
VFGGHASFKSLVAVSRSLASMLDAGVDIKKAFEVTGNKLHDARMRRVIRELEYQIRQGADVSTAMAEHDGYFPNLFIDMVAVGEETGNMPEVLRGLSEHYENRIRFRRDFLSVVAWPAFQFVAAVLIMALLIYVLGVIAQTRGGEPIDVLGLGLSGASGAIIWLTGVFGTVAGLFIVYMVLNRSLASKQAFDSFLMQLPVLGGCMRSFAVARFSWAFALTQQSGMSIKPSLESSLRATSNGAFIQATPRVWNDVQNGEFLGDALESTRLFPQDFIEMVKIAESSGTVPEELARMSPEFEDDARRKLSTLASVLGWSVWCCVALFVIVLIFRVASIYIGALNDAARGI